MTLPGRPTTSPAGSHRRSRAATRWQKRCALMPSNPTGSCQPMVLQQPQGPIDHRLRTHDVRQLVGAKCLVCVPGLLRHVSSSSNRLYRRYAFHALAVWRFVYARWILRQLIALPELLHLGIACQQLIECAFSVNMTVFEQDDVIGITQCCAPVRYHQACDARLLTSAKHALPKFALRLHVQRARKIVEDQQLRVVYEHPRGGRYAGVALPIASRRATPTTVSSPVLQLFHIRFHHRRPDGPIQVHLIRRQPHQEYWI